MTLGSLGEFLATVGEALIKDPILIIIILLVISKVWGVW